LISHILSQIPYERVAFKEPDLGKRQARPKRFNADLVAPRFVPVVAGTLPE
jgi:hypothetical protein